MKKCDFALFFMRVGTRCFVLPIVLLLFSSQAFCFSSRILNLDTRAKKEMIDKKIYNEGSCPLPLDRLRVVQFSYYDFQGVSHDDGEIVVMDAVAENVVTIFHQLYNLEFPIDKSRRIEFYNGSDELSLDDNNSSAFNCRTMVGSASSLPLIHSYGLAIDINPVQNPFVEIDDKKQEVIRILPKTGAMFLNRKNIRSGMVEGIEDIFAENGFRVWGGGWNFPIDWQHFQVPRGVAKIMTAMSSSHAKDFFSLYAKTPGLFDKFPHDKEIILSLYRDDPSGFMLVLKENFRHISELNYEDAIHFLEESIGFREEL